MQTAAVKVNTCVSKLDANIANNSIPEKASINPKLIQNIDHMAILAFGV